MNNNLLPIWTGNMVYDESVLPLLNEDGTLESISMMYKMDKILSVKSADLQNVYKEGVDYELDDGRLKILTGGNIPERQGNKLSHICKKMNDKEKVNVVFYGDSITEGANASGELGIAPYMEKWSQLVVNALKETYQYEDIVHINTALGGMDSVWGKENVKERVTDKKPDLLCIGFGMNDGNRTADGYQGNIESMIKAVSEEKPDCDIILIATMLPNKETVGFWGNQEQFLPVLKRIAQKYENVAVADMTTMHGDLLKGKRLFDMTGNNVNHPNDFLIRVYAQVINEVLREKEG